MRAEGVDVVVVDHHVAKEGHAVCTLVNPRVNDPVDAPWQALCTAGLVFKLIHGILKVLRLAGDDRGTSIAVKDYLDLAALGTIADLVPCVMRTAFLRRTAFVRWARPDVRVSAR